MFCPACSAYLSEKELIKSRVKYAPGNVPIEYEARCPRCSCEMGMVSWGQLTVNPDLAEKKNPAPEAPAETVEPQPQSEHKVCPHCGKPLPEDY